MRPQGVNPYDGNLERTTTRRDVGHSVAEALSGRGISGEWQAIVMNHYALSSSSA